MTSNKIILIFFITIFCSCRAQNKKINGVSFVSSRDSINTTHTQPVKKASANYVALMPFGFIKNLKSPNVAFNGKRQWYGETGKGLRQYANEFKKEHIKLMIKPQIWVWGGAYTGHIVMNSEEEWEILENSYKTFIITYAKIAEELDADIFCIGTELEQFVSKRPGYWKELIQKIRKVYSGKITYAANWDEFKRTPFWDKLDYIGIDAYFPVSDSKTPTVEDCLEGLKAHKQVVYNLSKKNDKPVLFTEFGYRSVDYAGKEPWKSDRSMIEVNLEAQTNTTRALFKTFWKEDWFAGGFVWKWFHNYENSGGEENSRFTPQNKPVEAIIKEQYSLK